MSKPKYNPYHDEKFQSPIDLKDINQSGAVANDAVTFNGTEWVPVSLNLKENAANKTTNFTGNTGSNTLFATVKATFDAIVGYLANYEPLLGFTPAKQDLSNLTSTAINQGLYPDSDVTYDAGGPLLRWYGIYCQYMRSSLDLIRFDIDSGFLYDVNEKEAVNLDSRNLVESGASVPVVQWEVQQLRAIDDSLSANWTNRQLMDATEQPSLSWNARQLLDNGGVASLDWQSRQLLDDSELIAVDYLDRRLYGNDGTTVVADFSNAAGITTITQAPDDNSNMIATTAYVDAQPKTVIQKFTASGTWTKPTGAKKVSVAVVSGSGGGGSGRCGALSTVRCGGGSGVASSLVYGIFDAADLPGSVVVTVGAKGLGGAAILTDNTNGQAGTAGGASSFGTYLHSRSAAGGNGGTNANGSGGVAQTVVASILNSIQIAGASASATGGVGTAGTSTTSTLPTPGGAGGGGNVSNAGGAGGAGGARTAFSALDNVNGGTAGAAGVAGGDGGVSSGKVFFGIEIGTGGGGGGGAGTIGGAAGGNAGGYGASGGGGGGGTNTFGSGKGGDGFGGIVVVMTEF